MPVIPDPKRWRTPRLPPVAKGKLPTGKKLPSSSYSTHTIQSRFYSHNIYTPISTPGSMYFVNSVISGKQRLQALHAIHSRVGAMRTTYGTQKSRFHKIVNLLALTTLPHASSYKLRTHHGPL